MPSFAPIPEIRSRFARDCARPEARAAFAAAASSVCASESVRGVANSFSRGGITTTARGGLAAHGGASARQPPLHRRCSSSSNEKRKEGARADASASAASRPHITCSTSAALRATGHGHLIELTDQTVEAVRVHPDADGVRAQRTLDRRAAADDPAIAAGGGRVGRELPLT